MAFNKKKKDKKTPSRSEVASTNPSNATTTAASSTAAYTAESTTDQETDDSTMDATAPPTITVSQSSPNASQRASLDSVDERTDAEKFLFELIKEKKVRDVKKHIKEHKTEINANCKDLEGNYLIQVAVKTKEQSIVRAVLHIDKMGIDIKEGLLQAIEDNQIDLVVQLLLFEDGKSKGKMYSTTQMLLQQKKSRENPNATSKASRKLVLEFDHEKYGNGITPLLQAAKHGHYEIMQLLYDRGERLPELHLPNCTCPLCKSETRELEKTWTRINLLKAMTNPNYMIFMASKDGDYDPVHEAFKLSKILSKCENYEPEYKKEYTDIKEELEKLPVSLLSLCRTMEETKILLSPREGYEGPENWYYPRLSLAILEEQKKFVAEPNCQFLMRSEFIGHSTLLEGNSKLVAQVLLVALSPIINLILWLSMCFCGGGIYLFVMNPVNRSLMKLGAHLYFCLGLLIMNQEERAEADIEPPSTYIRWLVLLYVICQVVSLIRNILLHPKHSIARGWNWFDMLTQGLFIASFLIWGWLFYRKSQLKFEEILPRRKLDKFDLLLVGECLFAVASTLTTFRLSRWYLLHPTLGPFQTAFAHMADSVKTVVIFFLWVIVTFCISSSILYRPYQDLKKWDEDAGKFKPQPLTFSEPKELFIHLFGLGEGFGPDKVEIFPFNKTYNATVGNEETLKEGNATFEVKTVANEQDATNYFTVFMCMVFNIFVMTFMKDATVGLFASTAETVLKAKEVEWKFTRVKEWIYYIEDHRLAPPFNILPNWACLCNVFAWVGAAASKGDKKAGCNFAQCCYILDEEMMAGQRTAKNEYPFLMRKLFQRYFQEKKWKESEEKMPTKKDKTEVEDKVLKVRKLVEGDKDPEPSTTMSTLAPPSKEPSVRIIKDKKSQF